MKSKKVAFDPYKIMLPFLKITPNGKIEKSNLKANLQLVMVIALKVFNWEL
jgi:hypothetical protein